MIIENDKSTVRFKGQRILYAILLGVMVFLLFYFFPEENPVYGVPKWIIVGVPVFAYVLFLIYHFVIDSTYVYFSSEKGLLVFRYFSMRLLGENRKSIEIPIDQLTGITVDRGFFSRKVTLTLYKRMGKGNAKYPPFSISLMARKDRDQLLRHLNTIVAQNQK